MFDDEPITMEWLKSIGFTVVDNGSTFSSKIIASLIKDDEHGGWFELWLMKNQRHPWKVIFCFDGYYAQKTCHLIKLQTCGDVRQLVRVLGMKE